MKITLIGGGSYSWTPGLYSKFMAAEFFPRDTEICLMDTNEKALADLKAYCELYNEQNPKMALKVTTTTCLEKAVEGADFVTVAISHGGLEAELEDHRIARRHGFYNIKGSEAGIAGASRTIRHVPEIVRMAKKIKKYSNNAYFFNVSNPLTAITKAIEVYGGCRTAGFCHGIRNHLEILLPYFGAESFDDVSFVVAGIDHCSFLLDVKYKGQDALEIMRNKGMIEAAWQQNLNITYDDPFAGRENQHIRFILWDILGYLPGLSDEHCAEFFYQAIGTPELRERFGMKYDRIAERMKSVDEHKDKVLEQLKTKKLPPLGFSQEIIAEVIEALCGGRPYYDVLNYKNVGQVANLPLGIVTETFCNVDAAGIHPVQAGPLPKIAESIVRPMALREDLYMEAAMEWDEKKLISALATDPIVNDFLRVKDVAHEIMEYNKQFLVKD